MTTCSFRRVSMISTPLPCSHTMRQKSGHVAGSGPYKRAGSRENFKMMLEASERQEAGNVKAAGLHRRRHDAQSPRGNGPVMYAPVLKVSRHTAIQC